MIDVCFLLHSFNTLYFTSFFRRTPVWCPTEEEQELDEHDMELVDVLADLM